MWKIWGNRPFRARVKISHQKGRKHVLIDPQLFLGHTRWWGLGRRAKRALEGGVLAHTFLRHTPTLIIINVITHGMGHINIHEEKISGN